MLKEKIIDLIVSAIPDAKVIIDTEDDVHFYATVISNEFENKNPVARQRLVYKSLGEKISDGTIHALSLKTFTTKEIENNA